MEKRHNAIPDLGEPDRPIVFPGKLAHRRYRGVDHAIYEAKADRERQYMLGDPVAGLARDAGAISRRDQGVQEADQRWLRQTGGGAQIAETARGFAIKRLEQLSAPAPLVLPACSQPCRKCLP